MKYKKLETTVIKNDQPFTVFGTAPDIIRQMQPGETIIFPNQYRDRVEQAVKRENFKTYPVKTYQSSVKAGILSVEKLV